MTAPPLRMLCCHVRRQQLIEMEERGLVRAPLSSLYLSVLPGAPTSASGSDLVVLISSSFNLFIVAVLRCPGEQWNCCTEPEERKLSSSGLTTSSNMVWLAVNGCSGSHCAVVWNRWRSPCCWCLTAQSVWEVFDTNKASSLQNQEQMVLENEAPLRSIEPPQWPSPHFSLSSTLCFSLPLFFSLHEWVLSFAKII